MGLFSRDDLQKELDKQKKENVNLLSNIQFLINLILEQELNNEIIHCPLCKTIDNAKIDIQISTKGFLQEKVLNGKIECLCCNTSTLIKDKRTIQDVKDIIKKWTMSESEIAEAYHIKINEFVKYLDTTNRFSDFILCSEWQLLTKLYKRLDKKIEDVIRDIKEKQKQTDRR